MADVRDEVVHYSHLSIDDAVPAEWRYYTCHGSCKGTSPSRIFATVNAPPISMAPGRLNAIPTALLNELGRSRTVSLACEQ